jgi:hypothetical protein
MVTAMVLRFNSIADRLPQMSLLPVALTSLV